jgi:hypothetical protein
MTQGSNVVDSELQIQKAIIKCFALIDRAWRNHKLVSLIILIAPEDFRLAAPRLRPQSLT